MSHDSTEWVPCDEHPNCRIRRYKEWGVGSEEHYPQREEDEQ